MAQRVGFSLMAGMLLLFAAAGVAAAQEEPVVLVLGEEGQWEADASVPRELVEVQGLLAQGKAKKAAKLAGKWVEANPASPAIDEGYWLEGEALFAWGRYYQAFEAYEAMLDVSPGTGYFEQALRREMEIARLFLAGKKRLVWGFIPASARTEGLEILDRVIDRWPASELAAEALLEQAEFYFGRGRFVEAQATYQVIVESYSQSRFYREALLRSAESTHAQYAGPRYDSTCLVDARVRYAQYRARFPESAWELGIGSRMERIDWEMAQKHFSTGDYYERTGREGAAKYYYEYVMSHWPETEWAEHAMERYEPLMARGRTEEGEAEGR